MSTDKPIPSNTRSRGVLLGFVMVFATLVVNASIAYLNLSRLTQNNRRVEESHEVLLGLIDLQATVIDAETGQRGYLITGDSNYLAPYQLATDTLSEKMRKFKQRLADNPAQQAHYAELEAQIERRMKLTAQNIINRREQGFDAARSMILEGEGKRTMDSIRLIVAKMEKEERGLLAERAAEARVSYWIALVTGIITTLLGLTMVGFGYLVVVRDIARRAQTARELEHAKDRLEERVRERTAAISDANAALRIENEERQRAEEQANLFALELQRSNRELEQFASVASHDLQEPLRKIQAFGDRLQSRFRDQLGETGKDYLDRMLASTVRMRKLIDDLLTYSRVSAKAQPFEPVNLGEVAREVAADLESRLQETGGHVEIGDLPTIDADPVQIRQMLQNLLGNALKFHRQDVPPQVQISARFLQGNGSTNDSPGGLRCELTVEDNGIGFDQNYVGRIFDLFQRLHGRDEYEGTGMGLAICRKIVERHGGQITAHSALGAGSRFVVTLPVEQPVVGADS